VTAYTPTELLAIVRDAHADDRTALAMLVGAYLESGANSAAVGSDGSLGVWQLHGNPRGADTGYAAGLMEPRYAAAVAAVDPALWDTDPARAAATAAYEAERPAQDYYATQGVQRVSAAYQWAVSALPVVKGPTVELWHPRAQRVTPANGMDGGPMDGVPWKIVLHTTEGNGYSPSSQAYDGGTQYWPHATIVAGQIYQHLPIDRSAYGLRHSQWPDTNSANAVQCETVWHAADPNWPEALLATLADWISWVQSQTGVPTHFAEMFREGVTVASVNSPIRFAGQEWLDFFGICGHSNVPGGNDHWDPGRLPVSRLAALLGSPQPAVVVSDVIALPVSTQEESTVAHVPHPNGARFDLIVVGTDNGLYQSTAPTFAELAPLAPSRILSPPVGAKSIGGLSWTADGAALNMSVHGTNDLPYLMTFTPDKGWEDPVEVSKGALRSA
jgi:hypothetical protein